jgi:hypothetical protein
MRTNWRSRRGTGGFAIMPYGLRKLGADETGKCPVDRRK